MRPSLSNVWDVSRRLDRDRRSRCRELATNTAASRRNDVVVRPKTITGGRLVRSSSRPAHIPDPHWGRPQPKEGPLLDRQLASAAVACLGCRGNAEQLGDLDTAASRTVGHITRAADQGLEGVVARLALILVKWHGRSDSSITEARGHLCRKHERPAGGKHVAFHLGILEGRLRVVNAGRIGSTCVEDRGFNRRSRMGGSSMIVRLRAMSREEVRRLDVQAAEELALPTSLLMENAGRGAAGWLAELVGAIPPDAGGRPFSLPPSAQSA